MISYNEDVGADGHITYSSYREVGLVCDVTYSVQQPSIPFDPFRQLQYNIASISSIVVAV